MCLQIAAAHWRQMKAHILSTLPEEACGLLGGIQNQVQTVWPITNSLHSPTRFRMEPTEQLKAFLWLEEHHQQLLGIFHSHPNGPPTPSATDLAECYYPEAFTLIWAPTDAQPWQLRCFALQNQQFQEKTWIKQFP